MRDEILNTIEQIRPLNNEWREVCKAHWDNLTKPLDSLGILETTISQIGAIRETEDVRIDRKACIVMCADNGVIEEGVTQCDNSITALVTEHLAEGIGNVNLMGRLSDVDVIPVDVGIATEVHHPKIRHYRVMNGTKNFTKEAAMSPEQCEEAILTGIRMAQECAEEGYDVLLLGEMGIGNTTTSSALAAVFLGCPVSEITGPGAGLSGAGIRRKIDAIERGIALHQPDPEDGFETLRCLGGLDIAGLAGVIIGGAACGLPVVLDGVITYAAAMAAVRIAPQARDYLIGSHMSSEPASQKMVADLGVKPVICADMSLGEGTGAVALMPLLEMALTVYRTNLTYADSGMDAYEHFSEEA